MSIEKLKNLPKPKGMSQAEYKKSIQEAYKIVGIKVPTPKTKTMVREKEQV